MQMTSSYYLVLFQTALNIVENWSANWQLRTQPTKFEFITFSLKPAANFSNQYYINEFILERVSSVVDLGITLTFDFKWHSYTIKEPLKYHLLHLFSFIF